MTLVSRFLTIILTVCAALSCPAQTHSDDGTAKELSWRTTPADSLLAEQILGELKQHAGEPVAGLMLRAGEALDGQPYVAGTLEGTEKEQLSIYLTRTDCILFVETCLALARTARSGGQFRELADELRQSRYRDGRVTAYADRLHYTTEWTRQGIRRGTLKDLTPALGGIPYDHPINYMSTHPDAYARMDDLGAIRSVEDALNAEPILYIPKERIPDALPGIRSGDILCFVSAIKGLDILHVAMAVVEADGTVRFRHASTGAMKVLLDPKPLVRYLEGRKNIAGIQVYRPL
jgi:hypothetical protein